MSYRVHSGDTLKKIAAQFHTSVGALARANGIRNVNMIRTGQVLQVPGRSDSFHAPAKGGARSSARAGGFGSRAAHLANVARGVFNSLQAAGLRIPRSASAYLAARTLANDNRFREVRLTDAQIRRLPPGAIVVSGAYNHPGNPHGHIAITLGSGQRSPRKRRHQRYPARLHPDRLNKGEQSDGRRKQAESSRYSSTGGACGP